MYYIIFIINLNFIGDKFMVADKAADSINKEKEQLDVLTSTRAVVKDALDRLGYPNEVYELLKDSMRILKVRIPVKMDDGSTKVRSEERRVGKECRSRWSRGQ